MLIYRRNSIGFYKGNLDEALAKNKNINHAIKGETQYVTNTKTISEIY
jgi:hypothetical protein